MSTLLNLARDVQGYPTRGAQFSTDMFSSTLAAGTAASFTVPSNYSTWLMRIKVQPTGWCWISRTTTAAVPAGDTFAASTSDMAVGTLLNEWEVYAGDVISMISANTTCDVVAALYPITYP